MAGLDDFFGRGAVQKNKKRIAKERDEGVKKQKTSKFFKKEPETIDLDDDEPVRAGRKVASNAAVNEEVIDLSSPKKASPRKASPRKSSPRKASPRKASPRKTPVRAKAEVKAVPADGPAAGGISAADILETIPDADKEFLHVDEAAAGMNYFQLKARQEADSPSGTTRQLPKARPNCLNGLTIVFTGVLPSIDRDTCERVAGQYGAKVTKSISGRTSLVVIGRDAGPKKVQKIKEKRIKCIDENGFIELLEKMPADGGSGEEAQKALAKKKEEEDRAIQEAEEEERAAEAARAARLASAANAAKKNGKSAPVRVVPPPSQLWTDKYAPTELKQICGNKGNVQNLSDWLENWFETPHPMKPFKGVGIDNYKAVLISGPPGTGKTTAANLVAKKLGYDIIEKNASDVRSKKLLNQELRVCLDNTSVAGYFKVAQHASTDVVPSVGEAEEERNDKRFVLIMDEVDGMSSGDNGGVAQLSQFCRITKTPMILICNDKSLPKMRQFDKVAFDMTWRRPTAREMRSRLMTIAHREGLKLDPSMVDELTSATHNDIRQIINIMSTVARTQKTLTYDGTDAAAVQKSWEKEVALKPFDVLSRLLSSGSYGNNAQYDINGKLNLFFNDIDMIPLMMHENYRLTSPARAQDSLEHLRRLDEAAESISASDLVNQAVRSGEQQWSLLPFQGVMSTLLPGSRICGRVNSRIMFTSWLGQNSKAGKFQRIVQQLQYHSSTKTGTNNQELRLSYVPYLKEMLSQPLVKKGAEGIPEVLELMDSYYLTKEDWDNIMDLGVGRGKMEKTLKKIPTAVKTAFTRKYNSYSHPTIIYKTGSTTRISGKQERTGYDGDVIDDDVKKEQEEENEEEQSEADKQDSLKKDTLIKAVKPKKKKK